MNMMTQEEWKAHTPDWKKGWRYGQGDVTVEPEPDSEEFRVGARYAIEHPFGSVYVPMKGGDSDAEPEGNQRN